MHELIQFQLAGHTLRAIRDDKGEPWCVAADVCAHCDIKNVSKACERLDADEKAVITLSDSAGRPQDMLIVNESGVYTLVMRSRKPEAKIFRKWVTSEVLPTIRKTGKYEHAQALDRFPELRAIVELAQATAEARVLAEEAHAKAEQAIATAARALESQLFFTVAEYIYVNTLQSKIPPGAYKACSDHLRVYCLDRAIPFRQTPVGGQRWDHEYSFHVSVFADALPGWLKRRFAQETLTVLPTAKEEPPTS